VCYQQRCAGRRCTRPLRNLSHFSSQRRHLLTFYSFASRYDPSDGQKLAIY